MVITPDEAWAMIVAHARILPVATRAIDDALWHVLDEPVVADRDIPPANRSAMDGFAVRADDVRRTPVELRVASEIAAGSPADQAVPVGACARIFTGANLPPGTDTVVMQEDTASVDGRDGAVRVLKSAPEGANVFKQGENARQGDELLSMGARLDPAAVALCAAVGRARVRVRRRPRVGLLTTGSELLRAGDAALPHQVRDSNSYFLRAVIAEHRYDLAGCERADDNLDALAVALHRLAKCSDVVVLTGGMSVGRYDFAAEAVRRIGATIRFHGVAMKPGKPQLFASDEEGRFFFGLPGNPLSAMVGFHEFVLPALKLLEGCPAERCRTTAYVRVADALTVKGKRQQYVPARLSWTGTGLEAVEVPVEGSADLVAGARADGALIVPKAMTVIPKGAFVAFRFWRAPL